LTARPDFIPVFLICFGTHDLLLELTRREIFDAQVSITKN